MKLRLCKWGWVKPDCFQIWNASFYCKPGWISNRKQRGLSYENKRFLQPCHLEYMFFLQQHTAWSSILYFNEFAGTARLWSLVIYSLTNNILASCLKWDILYSFFWLIACKSCSASVTKLIKYWLTVLKIWVYCLLALLHLGWFVTAPCRPTKQGCLIVPMEIRQLSVFVWMYSGHIMSFCQNC